MGVVSGLWQLLAVAWTVLCILIGQHLSILGEQVEVLRCFNGSVVFLSSEGSEALGCCHSSFCLLLAPSKFSTLPFEDFDNHRQLKACTLPLSLDTDIPQV